MRAGSWSIRFDNLYTGTSGNIANQPPSHYHRFRLNINQKKSANQSFLREINKEGKNIPDLQKNQPPRYECFHRNSAK
jgi:hypothetical protein